MCGSTGRDGKVCVCVLREQRTKENPSGLYHQGIYWGYIGIMETCFDPMVRKWVLLQLSAVAQHSAVVEQSMTGCGIHEPSGECEFRHQPIALLKILLELRIWACQGAGPCYTSRTHCRCWADSCLGQQPSDPVSCRALTISRVLHKPLAGL